MMLVVLVLVVVVLGAAAAATAPLSATAQLRFGAPIADPPAYFSSRGLLELDVYAVAEPQPQLQWEGLPEAPVGWVYRVCYRGKPTSCRSNFGGVRWQVSPGDTVKIRLFNMLPPNSQSDIANMEASMAYLNLNPTNLHFHGLEVLPNVLNNNTLGDYIFALVFNKANGLAPDWLTTLPGHLVLYDTVNYKFDVPTTHRPGLFWFHAHPHGVTQNQISAGMSGTITIGQLADYVSCAGNGGAAGQACDMAKMRVRHLNLKATQVLSSGEVLNQHNPSFCDPLPAENETFARRGTCAGAADFPGGYEFYTVNGQVFPTIPVASAAGEIWRIVNMCATEFSVVTLLTNTGRRLPVQVLAVDGGSVVLNAQAYDDKPVSVNGVAYDRRPCPGGFISENALCVDVIHLLPSSRIEVWVSHQSLLPGESPVVIMRRERVVTGPAGDDWPQADLATVDFTGAIKAAADAAQASSSSATSSGGGALAVRPNVTPMLRGSNTADADDPVFIPTSSASATKWKFGDCGLPAGFQRRMYLGVPLVVSGDDTFGMAVEVINNKGHVVPGSALNITGYNPRFPFMCVRNNTVERWILVNTAEEDHNFHLHNAKFQVALDAGEATYAPENITFPFKVLNRVTLVDNVFLPHADGDCGANQVKGMKTGLCRTHPVVVDIYFHVVGDTVAHCHIGEHSDGGMMMALSVVASPSAAGDASSSSKGVSVAVAMVAAALLAWV